MERISTTPFGARTVSYALIERNRALEEAATDLDQLDPIDKWALFHDVCAARKAFGVSDRDLTVLNALLSFYPDRDLTDAAPLIVFPSNRALSDRAHGMAESTLRRHLAALVAAGLIQRHDSPNGKRYAARDRSGSITRAFGFDLRPLLIRASEIAHKADEARDAIDAIRRLRETVSILLRDAVKLTTWGVEQGSDTAWQGLQDEAKALARAFRRRLEAEELYAMKTLLHAVLSKINALLAACQPTESKEMSGNATQSERHHQNSKPYPSESKSALEIANSPPFDPNPRSAQDADTAYDPVQIPLSLILKACPEVQLYAPAGIDHWSDLVEVSERVAGMLGISPHAWGQACESMGHVQAAITVACMLERSQEILKPGGYLRVLSEKATRGVFSTAPMVMALLNRPDRLAG